VKRKADEADITSPAAPHAKFLRGQQSTASTGAGSSAAPRVKSGGQQHATPSDRPAIRPRAAEDEPNTPMRTGIKAHARPSNAPGASRGIGFFNRAQSMLLKEVCVN
jgi:hypothetical protein